MKAELFTGTGVALVTPFAENGSVDHAALEKLVHHIVDGGVEYLVPLGTTAESVTLTSKEKKEIMSTVLKANNNRLPVVLGIGGNNTAEVAETIKATDFTGISGLLSVSPYYNKPSQRGIVEHYKVVCAASPVPVILYNVPGRTSSNMSADTTLAIAKECKNAVAMKEASGNLDQCMSIIKRKPSHFKLISGDDNFTLPIMAAGASGVISVVANIFPRQYSDMVRYCLKGDFEKARELHYLLFDFTNLIFAEGNPGGAKAALSNLGWMKNKLRLPLVPISNELSEKIKSEMLTISKQQ